MKRRTKKAQEREERQMSKHTPVDRLEMLTELAHDIRQELRGHHLTTTQRERYQDFLAEVEGEIPELEAAIAAAEGEK
jgi:hypothetical protein